LAQISSFLASVTRYVPLFRGRTVHFLTVCVCVELN
jgi:hypothetical protein